VKSLKSELDRTDKELARRIKKIKFRRIFTRDFWVDKLKGIYIDLLKRAHADWNKVIGAAEPGLLFPKAETTRTSKKFNPFFIGFLGTMIIIFYFFDDLSFEFYPSEIVPHNAETLNNIGTLKNSQGKLAERSSSNEITNNSNSPATLCSDCVVEDLTQKIRGEDVLEHPQGAERETLNVVSNIMAKQDQEFSLKRESALIQILQEELKNLGFENIVADGRWNSNTSLALISLAETNTCNLRNEIVDEKNSYGDHSGRSYSSINRNDLIENFDVNRNIALFDKVHNCIAIELVHQNNR